MSYYERNYEFLSQKELIAQVQSHYTGQALKQLYVLVLGLDVIGNPYGLVIGLKKGVEDLFYEPFQVCNDSILQKSRSRNAKLLRETGTVHTKILVKKYGLFANKRLYDFVNVMG